VAIGFPFLPTVNRRFSSREGGGAPLIFFCAPGWEGVFPMSFFFSFPSFRGELFFSRRSRLPAILYSSQLTAGGNCKAPSPGKPPPRQGEFLCISILKTVRFFSPNLNLFRTMIFTAFFLFLSRLDVIWAG